MEFTNVQEASSRWIKEGQLYKNKLNDWLDIIYMDEKKPETACPEETRKDMGEYVKKQIVEFNKEGKFDELRNLFPPDNDPMDWSKDTQTLSQVAILEDHRIIATIGDWYKERKVYLIENNQFKLVEDIFMFGKSFDKKYFAKVYPEKIEVTEGWGGASIKTFLSPKTYGADFLSKNSDIKDINKFNFYEMGIAQVQVFPSGNRVAIASQRGIFILEGEGSQFIQTENLNEEIDEEATSFEEELEPLSLDYPHIDISPDEKYIAAGSQSSPHLIFEEHNGIWKKIASVGQRSEYPNFAKFNYSIPASEHKNEGPQLLLSSCHFRRSATVSLPIKNIVPGFFASGYNADDTLNYINENKWVFSVLNYSWGFGLGCNDGYIWFKDYLGFQYGYLHIGGTVMDIDVSKDRMTMVVASNLGQIIKYKVSIFNTSGGIFRLEDNKEEKRLDDFAITNTSLQDIKRYLFLKGSEPLIW